MGSSRREVGRRSNEPLRPVRVTHAFYLGAREVTNAEFRAFKPDHDSGEFEGQSLERRRSARRERELGRGGAVPERPQRQGRAAARLRGRTGRLGGRSAAAQRLSLADRCRMGVGRAVRRPDEGPPLSVGRRAAAARSVGQLRGRLGRADAADGARHLRRRLSPSARPSAAIRPTRYGIFDLGGNVAEWIHDFYTLDVDRDDAARSTIRSGRRAERCTSCAARAGAARR